MRIKAKYEIVVIGTSWGGLDALETLFGDLPADFSLPIAVVQHRGVQSTESLATTLRRHTSLPVREPQDKEAILPGHIYLEARPKSRLPNQRNCWVVW